MIGHDPSPSVGCPKTCTAGHLTFCTHVGGGGQDAPGWHGCGMRRAVSRPPWSKHTAKPTHVVEVTGGAAGFRRGTEGTAARAARSCACETGIS